MRSRVRTLRRPGRQSGFSMIEVLIALVVLAFGLLGLALMQTLNLRYTQSAQQRTLAVNLASELLDTMRTNRSQLAVYAMGVSDFDTVSAVGGCPTYNPATAAANIERWQCEVKETLGPDAYADVDVTNAPTVSVTVHWTDPADTADLDGAGKIELKTTL
ncbi:type IV pilus modification protein PilV [Luteimonas saliphila]|uniref:type IV pilus modification protein PilV n=1 Tax=Luteimonas saliphila TaxID=2804919 RepID=UPI00192D986E|nr:type IV pilus modification protein PilV [Luteimonas saliphila]